MTAEFIVITGGPCSGKTTIIDALAKRGHTTVPEAATELIEDPTLEDLRSNPREFQLQVLRRQLENEGRVLETADAGSVVFLDRGVGDGFSYLRYHGIEPLEELGEAWSLARRRSRSILFFESRPDYQPASHRSETPAEASRIQELLLEDYRSRHDRVLLIPWLPIEERLATVLEEAGLEDREA
jgi:predicted ATPase